MSFTLLDKTAEEECKFYNINREYEGLKKLMSHKDYEKNHDENNRKYKKARLLLLDYVITCTKHDKKRGDYWSEENVEKLKEAGRLLNEEGGMRSMKDPLVWSFIPYRYHREIDNYWNGIGEWLA